MGKRLRQQRRGKASPTYIRPSHRFKADVVLPPQGFSGKVIDFVDDPARSALLMKVSTETGKEVLLIAPEGIKINDSVSMGDEAPAVFGSVLPLSRIPDGFPIFNVELRPHDGGKLVKTAGSSAYVISRDEKAVLVKLPSKALKNLDPRCRAQIGVVCGGGRSEKPFFKAGKKFHVMKARNMDYPKVRGVAMNAVAHPFGGKEHHRGKASTMSRNAPPGRKVGHLAARRTGRRKRG